MTAIQIRCPKCGASNVEKNKNQEYVCKNCQKTFYFVTPNTHSSNNNDRYIL